MRGRLAVVLAAGLVLSAAAAEAPLTLEVVREAVAGWKGGVGPAAAPIELAGYNFHWEVRIGGGLVAVVVSRNLAGSVLVFGEDGRLRAGAETGEVTWLQLFDFDGDGTAELVTEQVEARGTGVLVKRYHVHRVTGVGLEELWRGIAYSHTPRAEPAGQGEAAFEVKRGYLRLEPAGGGVPGPRLLHVVETSQGPGRQSTERQAYLFEAGAFRKMGWPEVE